MTRSPIEPSKISCEDCQVSWRGFSGEQCWACGKSTLTYWEKIEEDRKSEITVDNS